MTILSGKQIDDIRWIQERYAWFLDGVFADAVFEKKKGQKKIPLAPMICSRGYEAFISGVSLGENPETDAPPVKTQYRIRGEKENAEIVEKMYFDRLLELWHGPTSAFKDMALQLLPQLLSTALKKTGEKNQVLILVATSGDTGKAALEGFRDVDQTKIIVFYPENGVSRIQRLQMVTQQGNNVAVTAVKGNFDDAQSGVKAIFSHKEFNEKLNEAGVSLSSANSINWGRLVPQIVYYFSAYADLLKAGKIKAGDKISFTVPTGNFGDILAGYYAMRMGLPVAKLICASNTNNVLTDFLKTGVYDRNRDFYKTISPSMDILISSNLEDGSTVPDSAAEKAKQEQAQAKKAADDKKSKPVKLTKEEIEKLTQQRQAEEKKRCVERKILSDASYARQQS